jgi:predicted RND superfamily exporter protein
MHIERLGQRLASAIVARPWTTIALCVLSWIPLAAGMRDVVFSTNYRVFFAEDDAHLATFDALESEFTRTDDIVLVVRPQRGDVFAPETLSVVQELTDEAWRLPYATRVDSLTNFQHSRSVDDDMVVGPLFGADPRAMPEPELSGARRIAMDEPLLVGGLLARDARATGVHVTLRLPRVAPSEVTEAVEAARALAERAAAAHPHVEIRVSGMALFNDAFREAAIRDITRLLPLMYVVMLVTMTLLLGSFSGTLAITLVVVLASGAAIGAAGWLGYPLTPPSAAAPTIVLTLAVAEGIHIVSALRQGMRRGLPKQEAIVEALRTNLRAVILTSGTTIFGFACLNVSDSPPYRHLANMASVGIAVALIHSVTLLPAILSLIPITAAREEERGARWARALIGWVVRSHRSVLAGATVLAIGSTVLVWNMETEEHFLAYFDESIRFRRDTDFMLEHLTGIYTLEYQVDSGEPAGIHDPAYLRRLAAFTEWLREQPEVRHVYSFSDVIARLFQNLHGDDPAYRRVPASRADASQALLLYELSLPPGTDLTDRLDLDRSTSRVSVVVGDLSSRELTAFTERSEAWLRASTPRPMWATATAPVIVFTHMSARNAESMIGGNVIDLIAMSLALIFAFRSVRLGLLSMVPNVLPILLAYGVWALTVGENNIVVSVAGTICLGIVVDDTIHFMSKYRMLRAHERMTPEQAVVATFGSVGVALLVTTVVLILGFGVLALSGFQMNQQFGMLAVLMIGIALPGDLVVLPALLLLFDRGVLPTRATARDMALTRGSNDASEDVPPLSGSTAL